MNRSICILTSALLATAVFDSHSLVSAQETLDTHIGKLTFESGYPSKETVSKLYDEMDFQRASQAYLWGIPAVGLNEWRRRISTSSGQRAARCCPISISRRSSAF